MYTDKFIDDANTEFNAFIAKMAYSSYSGFGGDIPKMVDIMINDMTKAFDANMNKIKLMFAFENAIKECADTIIASRDY